MRAAAHRVAASTAMPEPRNGDSAASSPCSRTTSLTRLARATCSVSRSHALASMPAGASGGTNPGAKWLSQSSPAAASASRARVMSDAVSQLIRIGSLYHPGATVNSGLLGRAAALVLGLVLLAVALAGTLARV